MRLNRTTILALALAAGTVLGSAAPAGAQAARPTATCTVCRIVMYEGGGSTKEVGPDTLPALDTAPETITAGADTLKFDVAGLQGPWGGCGSDCSEWRYTATPTRVYVGSFTVNGETEHALQSVGIFSPPTYWVRDPHGLGTGVWTPICLEWQGGSIKLNLETYKWSVEAC